MHVAKKCRYTRCFQNLAILLLLLYGHPVVEERGVAPHEGNGQLLEEAKDFLAFLLASVSCFGTAQLFNLCHTSLVPGPKDSTARGTKKIPSRLQASQDLSSFRL